MAKIRSSIIKLYNKSIDTWEYYYSKIIGQSYSEYYANRMNRIVKHNPNWGINLNKKFHLDFLISQGLNSKAEFLDYGCGALASGMHFIDFLDTGKYTGVDISLEAVKEGIKRVENRELANKKPIVKLIKSGEIQELIGKKFDVIWAQSVFTHLPPNESEKIISELKSFISPAGRFYLTFCITHSQIEQRNYKDWFYPISFFEEVASRYGLNVNIVKEWKHPEDTLGVDTLIYFSLKS